MIIDLPIFFMVGIVRTTSDVLSSSAVPTTTINDNDDDDDEFNDMIEQCINCETQHSSGNNKVCIFEMIHEYII